jgi:methylated-DNA-[protein]-cysteine S-methyltransferase
VPCHRILGAGGALGAYSAGDGPTTKSWLLDHERRNTRGTLL